MRRGKRQRGINNQFLITRFRIKALSNKVFRFIEQTLYTISQKAGVGLSSDIDATEKLTYD
jgi:hypothetical protein